jgi:DNA-binding response OmpR family regulator
MEEPAPARRPIMVILVDEGALRAELRGHLSGRDIVISRDALAAAGLRLDSESTSDGTGPEIIRYFHLEIDLGMHLARWRKKPINVSERELSLLAILAGKVGRAFSFSELTTQAWGPQYRVDPPVLHSAMRRLRAKLASADADVVIESVRGYGFRLAASDGHACHIPL